MVWSLIRMEVLRFEPSRVGYRVGGKTIELWSLDMQERGARAFKNPCGTLVTRKRRLQPLGSGCKTAAGIEMTAARPPWCSRPSRRRPSALPRMVRSDRSSVAPWKGSRPKDPKEMSQQKPLARGRRGTPFVTRKASTRTPGCSKVPHCKNAIEKWRGWATPTSRERRGRTSLMSTP